MESLIATEILVALESGETLKGETLKIISLEEDFYISAPEGLKAINAPLNWINQTYTTKRTAQALREFGFSGEIKTIVYKNNLGCFRTEVMSFLDWLSIWALFASRRNIKAAKLLRLFATKGLKERICNSCGGKNCPNGYHQNNNRNIQ